MPVRIPSTLPAVEELKKENIFVIEEQRASSQDIRPLRIAVLNLMPLKLMTETDLLRLISNTPLQIELDLVLPEGHEWTNTPREHLEEFYKSFNDIKKNNYDGFIVTGAPVEMQDFETVDYWPQLQEIFDWSRTHVRRQSISAGLPLPDYIITTASVNTCLPRNSPACSSTAYLKRAILCSEVSTTCSTCLTAAIAKCARKTYLKCPICQSSRKAQRAECI